MTEVVIKNVIKRYGENQAVQGINLEIKDGEFAVLVGPSGCGKSTTLRMIAGLESVTEGDISIGGRRVNDLPPRERNISMVFQNYALYPHMTVRENLGFSLKIAKLEEQKIAEAVNHAAEILGLDELMDRRPAELSGGQRQRVAMGRAIVREPDVFLFDEPLSNLDAKLRTQMRVEIKKLHQHVGNTIIYVTHDQVEAMTLADKIVVLRDGRVEQVGSPIDLYQRPANAFVAQFIGSPKMNFFQTAELAKNANKKLTVAGINSNIGLRPEHLAASSEKDAIIGGTLDLIEQLGEYALVHLNTNSDESFIVKMDVPPEVAKGAQMWFTANPYLVHLFDQDTGLRINS